MDSDTSPPRSRRTRHDDDDRSNDRDQRSKESRHDTSDRYRERDKDRRRSRERDRRRRRRSKSPRSPDSHRRASRSRDRDRDRHRDSDRHRRRSPRPDDRHRDRVDRESRRKRDRDTEDKGSEDDRSRGKQVVKRSGPLPSQSDSFALTRGEEPPKSKEQPNYGITGTLAAASNSVVQSDGSTIVLKYHEPPEARKPAQRDQWKLFIFKGQEIVDTVELNHRSCWLVGREVAVVDLAAEHPSISKQHAVIQFRYLEKRNEFGDKIGKVKPYLIDLESANGTMLNSKQVPESRYLELRDKDLIQFGQSTREYVLMLAPKD